jgi:outer membrane protein TolC
MGGASSLGQLADATVAIPLLRGSGQYIVQEPLTQAERNVVYAINDFERFKRAFAVDIAGGYLAVLRQMDETANAAQNYRSLIASARRARRLADAGRLPEIQVDQAVQNELRARDRWIAAIEQLENRLDAFKAVMGLPPDARVELDRKDLQRLSEKAQKTVAAMKTVPEGAGSAPPSDAPIDLPPPEEEGAGPMEMDPEGAIRLALENRLDLRSAIGAVFDSQRKVVVAADALRGELTLSGSATVGEGRSVDSADLEDAQLRFDKGQYGAFLTLDLPLERTAEQIAYRNSFIALEEAVRDVQELEDQIKISIQTSLRTLRTARESMSIQGRAVAVAQKRVRSINLFLEAGRAEVRDLLEAEESLFSAQNALTAALIDYRIAELRLQADMGLLALNEEGLWREYIPKGAEDDVR